MCDKAVDRDAYTLEYVPDNLKTRDKMCDKAVDCGPWQLEYVPNYFKTKKMCERVVEKIPAT